MLSIVRKESITHDLLVANNEVNELQELHLPEGWWQTTLSHDLKKEQPQLQIIPIEKPKGLKTKPALPKMDNWDIREGDYRVSNPKELAKRLTREHREVVGFAQFSFALVVTIVAVVLILSLVARV